MIPLQSTTPVRHFPKVAAILCLLLIILDVVSRVWIGARSEFLLQMAWIPASGMDRSLLSAALFFPNLFSLFMNVLFLWVFLPRLLERRGLVWVLLCGIAGLVISAGTFSCIFSQSQIPRLIPEALIGVWLGAQMRRDIWATVNSLVLGLGWIRVLEVPSYVQLFFWFFYQLIANLFLPEAFQGGPMPYLLGLLSFLIGFLLDSFFSEKSQV